MGMHVLPMRACAPAGFKLIRKGFGTIAEKVPQQLHVHPNLQRQRQVQVQMVTCTRARQQGYDMGRLSTLLIQGISRCPIASAVVQTYFAELFNNSNGHFTGTVRT
jgi:hypothetical protein